MKIESKVIQVKVLGQGPVSDQPSPSLVRTYLRDHAEAFGACDYSVVLIS